MAEVDKDNQMDERDDGSADEDGSDDEGDEGSEEEEQIQPKSNPKRATRGQRISDMNKEGDDQFWQQEFFKDDQNDEDYEKEEEEEDTVDADFDDKEDSSDDGEEEVEKEKPKKKGAAGAYKEPSKARQKAIAAMAGDVEHEPEPKKRQKKEKKEINPDEVRKSARPQTVARTADREANEAMRQAKPKRKRAPRQYKTLSQAQHMQEAVRTEKINKASLEELLRIEELKKKVVIKKATVEGPAIRYHSWRDSKTGQSKSSITFTETHEPPSYLHQRETPYRKKMVCKVTGAPAKYLDPRTGYAYANAEAFKQLQIMFPASAPPKKEAPVPAEVEHAMDTTSDAAIAKALSLGEEPELEAEDFRPFANVDEKKQGSTGFVALPNTAPALSSNNASSNSSGAVPMQISGNSGSSGSNASSSTTAGTVPSANSGQSAVGGSQPVVDPATQAQIMQQFSALSQEQMLQAYQALNNPQWVAANPQYAQQLYIFFQSYAASQAATSTATTATTSTATGTSASTSATTTSSNPGASATSAAAAKTPAKKGGLRAPDSAAPASSAPTTPVKEEPKNTRSTRKK